MKKFFFLVIALALCASNANAFDNEPEEGLTWMGLFGMNVSKLQNLDYGAKAGAMMGIRADYMLPNAHGAYVTAGLDWTMKGGKVSREEPIRTIEGVLIDDDEDVTRKYNLHYMEIPIRVGFRYNVTEQLGFYGELGPYFAIGIGGKHKKRIDKDGDEINLVEEQETYKAFKKVLYDNNNPRYPFQRWDAGLSFRIGAEYEGHYNLMLGCDWGLADMYRNNFRDSYYDFFKGQDKSLPKVHNFNFSITLGYRF